MLNSPSQAGAKGQASTAQLDADNSQRMGEPHLASSDLSRGPSGGAEGTALDSNAAGGALYDVSCAPCIGNWGLCHVPPQCAQVSSEPSLRLPALTPSYALQEEACFPYDFPDTLAYAQLAAELAAEQDAHCSLRPRGRCPEGTPHPPRWDLAGSSATLTAHSSGWNLLKAPAPGNDAVAAQAMSLDPGQPEEPASIAAGAAQNAALDESGGLASPPEEPAAMEVGGLEQLCPSMSNTQAHHSHAELAHSSVAAPFYVARSHISSQQCLQSKPQRQPDQQPPTQGASMVGLRASRGSEQDPDDGEGAEANANCMVCVSLQTVGPGVLHEGAAIISLSVEEASSIRRSMLGHKLLCEVLTLHMILA